MMVLYMRAPPPHPSPSYLPAGGNIEMALVFVSILRYGMYVYIYIYQTHLGKLWYVDVGVRRLCAVCPKAKVLQERSETWSWHSVV